MKIVIDIPEYNYRQIKEYYEKNDNVEATYSYIYHGTSLPKGHSFIAICDSDFPITEEVKQYLKDIIFVGNEDCPTYCFEMTEIIEADKAESE